MVQPGRITGHYNNIYNKFRIEAWLPKFNLGKSMFESGYLVCDNPNDKVNLQLKRLIITTRDCVTTLISKQTLKIIW